MGQTIKINYINRSINEDLPKIFVFAKNEIPTFDALKDGVAWKVIEDIGRGSSCHFDFPLKTSVCATWDNNSNKTAHLPSIIGKRYTVSKDSTGIVLLENGDALDPKAIEINSTIHTQNGISTQLYKDGKMIMKKKTVAFNQKATFVLHPKLYWGIASEIQEGEDISSAVLNSDYFFELTLDGLSEVTLSLNGNAKDGYSFKVEKQE
jgi:hypothetical protein